MQEVYSSSLEAVHVPRASKSLGQSDIDRGFISIMESENVDGHRGQTNKDMGKQI